MEQGYEQTTVSDIARRADLTERTFFRYFADKREVLFGGSRELHQALVDALSDAPLSAAPIDAVAQALKAAGALLQGRRSRARQRQRVIDANTDLRERELIKLASLAAALAEGLRARGVDEPAAHVTAEAGIAVFKVAFSRWLESSSEPELARHIDQGFAQLRALMTAGDSSRAPA